MNCTLNILLGIGVANNIRFPFLVGSFYLTTIKPTNQFVRLEIRYYFYLKVLKMKRFMVLTLCPFGINI